MKITSYKEITATVELGEAIPMQCIENADIASLAEIAIPQTANPTRKRKAEPKPEEQPNKKLSSIKPTRALTSCTYTHEVPTSSHTEAWSETDSHIFEALNYRKKYSAITMSSLYVQLSGLLNQLDCKTFPKRNIFDVLHHISTNNPLSEAKEKDTSQRHAADTKLRLISFVEKPQFNTEYSCRIVHVQDPCITHPPLRGKNAEVVESLWRRCISLDKQENCLPNRYFCLLSPAAESSKQEKEIWNLFKQAKLV